MMTAALTFAAIAIVLTMASLLFMTNGMVPSLGRSITRVMISLATFSFGCAYATAVRAEAPRIVERVTDMAGVLSPGQRSEINFKLERIESGHADRPQVVVLTVTTLGGVEIEPYAHEVFRANKIGQVDKNNGVLILIATADRKLRIEVGYGLEGVIPDATAKRITSAMMVPKLRERGKEDYAGAINAAVDEVGKLVTAETAVPASEGGMTLRHVIITLSLIGFFAALLFFVVTTVRDTGSRARLATKRRIKEEADVATAHAMLEDDYERERERRRMAAAAAAAAASVAGFGTAAATASMAMRPKPPRHPARPQPPRPVRAPDPPPSRRRRDDDDSGAAAAIGAVIGALSSSSSSSDDSSSSSSSSSDSSFSGGGGDSGGGGSSDNY